MVRKEKVLKETRTWWYQLLLTVMLSGVMLFGWARAVSEGTDGVWPPAGKEEGCLDVTEALAGVYVCHYADSEDVFSSYNSRLLNVSPGKKYDYDSQETVMKSHLIFVSGDERLKDAFRVSGAHLEWDGLKYADADGAQATFRLDAESEHYYGSVEFTINTVNFENITVELPKDGISIAGKTLDVYDILYGNTLRISPEMICDGRIEKEVGDYSEIVETDQYTIEWGRMITFKQAGQYPLYLYITLGRNDVAIRKPVTIDVKSIAGEATAEIAGKGDASQDQNLELKLSQGDGEYTLYAGGTSNHIGYWDIVDYDNLKAAWGGEPGWSIQPTENSEDVLRWSNVSTNNSKRIFAFLGAHLEPAIAGEYESILTCTWHGQTASAKIRLHVIDSPTGALKGITGIEEAYTMKVGETLDLYPLTNPVGWIPPEGTFALAFSSLHCHTDDEYSYEQTGGPYFHILSTEGKVGPMSLTALKSGEYDVSFYASAANFEVHLISKITVQNADGTIPSTAADMQDAPSSVLKALRRKEMKEGAETNEEVAETESAFFQYEKTDGGITVKKIIPLKEELIIPAILNGQNVVSISYGALDTYMTDGLLITSLVIEEGVERIEQQAFRSQKKLKQVWLPDSLKNIGYGAFEDCAALTEIRLPSAIQVNQIGESAFRRIGAESLLLPNGTDLMKRSLEQHLRGDKSAIRMSTYAEPFEYMLNENEEVYIIDYSGPAEQTVSVSRGINGRPVRIIGRNAFANKTWLRKIKLPEGLEEIGERAFYGCTALEEVSIPSTVTVIGSKAFAKVAVTHIALPENVTGAATDWFTGPERTDSTGNWKYLLLPDGTAELSEYAYNETITFPSQVDGYTVTAIQPWGGTGNPSDVRKIILPDTLKVIEADAFTYMNLTELALPEGLERIGDRAFSQVKLKQLILPESLISIGDEAFAYHEIDELVFPAGLKSIGNAAFNAQGKYPSKVTFKGFATEIGKGVFGYSFSSGIYDDPFMWQDFYTTKSPHKVETITLTCYPGSTADQLYQENVKKNYLEWGEEGIRTAPAEKLLPTELYGEDELIFEIIVPEGVEEIAEGAFRGMKALNQVTLPTTLKSIGPGAFEGCTALKEIELPERVTTIPSNAFKGCISLSKVTVGKDGLLRIGSSAFMDCIALTDLKLGNRLTDIGELAFAYAGLKKMVLPDTVTKIGNNAFAASAITSLTLPKGLTEIPEQLCYNALNLKMVTLPIGITAIGSYAFHNCGLSKLTLPEGLVSIGEGAFMMFEGVVDEQYYWSNGKKPFASLKSLKLPASLETIGKDAFACQDALTGISFAKGSKLREIGDGAFRKCLNLKEVKLPDSLESIGGSAFTNCFGLKKADLGGGVKSIGDSAFAKDSNMTDLTAPDSLTGIGKNLLDGHGDKLTVTCGAGSAMEAWLQINAPEITIKHPKQK